MKIVFAVLLMFAFASCTDMSVKMEEMIAANAEASDAVDTVKDLLEELKNSIYEEQAAHEE
jgi:hypothetical protein